MSSSDTEISARGGMLRGAGARRVARLATIPADQWVAVVMPKAMEVVNWTGPVVDRTMTVHAVPVTDVTLAPYGPFMLSWFGGHTHDPTINYLTDYRIYYAMSHWCFNEFLANDSLASRALRGLARIRIAVTNDVLQVMSPVAPGRYSMIRHHALMLFAATRWLPTSQRSTWMALYNGSLTALRARAPHNIDMRRFLDRVEDGALTTFQERKESVSDMESAFRFFEQGGASMARITDYLLYTNAAVGLVSCRWRAAMASGWTEASWTAAEICRYHCDDYLLEDFQRLAVPAHPTGRRAMRPGTRHS